MATSGYVNIAVTNNDTLRFEWSAGTQSIENNTTPVSWAMKLIADEYGHITSSYAKAWSVTVDGQTYSGTNYVAISNGETKTLASGTKTISHNADGTKTFSFSFSQEFRINFGSGYVDTVNGSGSGVLNTIPRASQPTVSSSSSSVTMGDQIIINTNRASTSFTHTLNYVWQGGDPDTTGLSASTGVTDSVTFTPPKTLANAIPNATSAVCTIYCKTYNGSTLLGTKTCTVSINISSDIKPTVSAVVTDANGYASTFGGYVAGKSKYNVALTEAGSYGSTIASRTITMNGQTYTTSPAISNVIQSVDYDSIECRVKDSRGVYSDIYTANTTVLAYSPPAIDTFSVSRCNSDGSANDEGEYAKVTYDAEITALNDINTKTLTIKYKKVLDSTYTDHPVTISSYKPNDSEVISGIDGLHSYDFALVVNDYFDIPTEQTMILSTAFTLLDMYKDGTGLAVGKVAESANLFDCALPAKFREAINNSAGNPVGVIAEYTEVNQIGLTAPASLASICSTMPISSRAVIDATSQVASADLPSTDVGLLIIEKASNYRCPITWHEVSYDVSVNREFRRYWRIDSGLRPWASTPGFAVATFKISAPYTTTSTNIENLSIDATPIDSVGSGFSVSGGQIVVDSRITKFLVGGNVYFTNGINSGDKLAGYIYQGSSWISHGEISAATSFNSAALPQALVTRNGSNIILKCRSITRSGVVVSSNSWETYITLQAIY